MARRNSTKNGLPWLRKLANGTRRWYLPTGLTGGKPVAITDQHGSFVDGPENKATALQLWHEIVARGQAPDRGDQNVLADLFDLYLSHLTAKGAAPKTVAEYTKVFAGFCRRWPGLTVRDLKPHHLKTWWEDTHPNWKESGGRYYSATAIMAALNWAQGADSGQLIPKNPLGGMSMPKNRPRGAEVVLTDEEYARVLAVLPADLKDVFVCLNETGTRPGNVSYVQARHCDLAAGTWLLDKHKSFAKTGRPLVVYLTPTVVEICRRLTLLYPEGPLFRTKKGVPWNPQKLGNRLLWYAKRLGLKGRLMAYGARHGVATRLLEQGVPDAHVAAVLGHSNTNVLHKNYSHLGSKIKTLRDIVTSHSVTDRTGTAAPTPPPAASDAGAAPAPPAAPA